MIILPSLLFSYTGSGESEVGQISTFHSAVAGISLHETVSTIGVGGNASFANSPTGTISTMFEGDYTVTQLSPNPNPLISRVELGGEVLRYYKVLGLSSGNGLNGVTVEFTNGSVTKTFTSNNYNEIPGIIQVAINSSELGGYNATYQLQLSKLNGVEYDGPPVEFLVEVLPRHLEKTFELERDIEIGLGGAIGGTASINLEDQANASLTMIENDGDMSLPDGIGIEEQFTSGLGIEIGIEGGTSLDIGPVSGGVYGGLSGGGFIIMEGKSSFGYNYSSGNDYYEALSKMLNLTLAALTLNPDPKLSRAAFFISNLANHDFLESASGGIGLKGVGSGNALAGINSQRTLGLGLGVMLSGSAEIGGIVNFNYDKINDNYYSSLTLFDKVSLSGGLGLISWKKSNSSSQNHKKLNKINDMSKLGIAFNLVDLNRSLRFEFDNINGSPEYRFVSSRAKGDWSREFRIGISHPNLNQLVAQSSLEGLVSIANPSAVITPLPLIGANFVNNSIDAFLSKVYDYQDTGYYPPIDYAVDSSYTSNSGGLNISIDWAIALDIDFGFGFNWRTSHTAKKERGVFLLGNDYPLQKYNDIPQINTSTFQTVKHIFQEGFDNLTLQNLFNSLFLLGSKEMKTIRGDTTLVLSEIGSTINIDPVSLPPDLDSLSCQSWNWYGNKVTTTKSSLDPQRQKVAESIKRQQQSLARMDYGIGGFYKFSPQALPLTQSATINIVYPDSDVVNMTESNLALFYQDTVSSEWKYIGGVVDSVNNIISTQVDTLQLYTIAPIMPHGRFGLHIDSDTLMNNGATGSLWSDTLYLSNGNKVGNDVLYTIRAENVSIEAEDADTTIAGTQIKSVNSTVAFNIKSLPYPGNSLVRVESVNGLSYGTVNVFIADTTNPNAPEILDVAGIDAGIRLIVSNPDTVEVSQYEVYFDYDSGEPYEGIALEGGENSPFLIGASDTIRISSLPNDTLVYVAVRGIDAAGNRSDYSNEVSASPIDSVSPGVIDILDFTVMADSNYLARWIAKGDNGNSGKAFGYELRYSNASIADTMNWWQNATILTNVPAPNYPGLYDFCLIPDNMVDTTYYLGIKTIDEAGNESDIALFNIREDRATRSISIAEGWNLLSLPLEMPYAEINELFPATTSGPYIFKGNYQVSDSIKNFEGFWLKTEQGYTKHFNSGIISDTVVNLKNGWNLIGVNTYRIASQNVYTEPEGILSSVFYAYGTSGYQSADTLIPGRGYWIKTSAEGNMILPGEIQNNRVAKKTSPDKGILFRQANNRVNNLYLASEEVAEGFVAPPLPPTGAPDIRFASHKLAEGEKSGSYEVLLKDLNYPVEVSLFGLSDMQYRVTGKISGKDYGIIDGSFSAMIDDENENVLVISVIDIPESYYLEQNYPNPFNPSTTIKFGLPEESKVTIRIYDILGQEVQRIVNNNIMKAGHHKIEWNASHIASGVYFYRIETDNFMSVKKMILLK